MADQPEPQRGDAVKVVFGPFTGWEGHISEVMAVGLLSGGGQSVRAYRVFIVKNNALMRADVWVRPQHVELMT